MFGSRFLDLVFPRICAGCRAQLSSKAFLCESCYAAIPRFQTLFCAVCLARLPQNTKTCHPGSSYRFGAATSYHAESVRTLIHLLKFNAYREAAEPLARLVNEYLSHLALPLASYAVTAVPLGASRKRERGFNHADLIAEPVARAQNLPFIPNMLERIKNRPPQSGLTDKIERRENVKDCFRAPSALVKQYSAILLVDDVRTSGATLDEAVRTLREAGAKRILAVTAAVA
jgi:ComF family protein